MYDASASANMDTHTQFSGQPLPATINHSNFTKTIAITKTCQQYEPHHLSDADVVFLLFSQNNKHLFAIGIGNKV